MNDARRSTQLNGGSRVVLVCVGVQAAVVFAGQFVSELFGGLLTLVFLIALAIGGGGAVAALRGSGSLNRGIGLFAAAWVFVTIGLALRAVYLN